MFWNLIILVFSRPCGYQPPLSRTSQSLTLLIATCLSSLCAVGWWSRSFPPERTATRTNQGRDSAEKAARFLDLSTLVTVVFFSPTIFPYLPPRDTFSAFGRASWLVHRPTAWAPGELHFPAPLETSTFVLMNRSQEDNSAS